MLDECDGWQRIRIMGQLQSENLGDRIFHALKHLKLSGYSKACIRFSIRLESEFLLGGSCGDGHPGHYAFHRPTRIVTTGYLRCQSSRSISVAVKVCVIGCVGTCCGRWILFSGREWSDKGALWSMNFLWNLAGLEGDSVGCGMEYQFCLCQDGLQCREAATISCPTQLTTSHCRHRQLPGSVFQSSPLHMRMDRTYASGPICHTRMIQRVSFK